MKNYNFVRFYFGKERCHLQSEVKRNYVMAPKMALKVAPKNKLLTSSTIPYLPKTRLGSLLITSKLPLMYERRILVLFSKATFSIYYVYMCTCIHVFMNTRFSLFQQENGCKAVCLIRRIFVDSA